MFAKDLDLTLNSETFSALKTDFDTILNRTLGNMTMRNAEEATITIKVGVSLKKTNVCSNGNMREITQPTFKHEVSSVMQMKDKMSGQLVGDMELVWDEDQQTFVLRPIVSGQTSMFDDNGDPYYTDVVDVEHDPQGDAAALPEPAKELPQPKEEADDYEYDDPEDEG